MIQIKVEMACFCQNRNISPEYCRQILISAMKEVFSLSVGSSI
jgi:hypothetical protein